MTRATRAPARGQVIVLMVVGFLAIIAAVALVIDGGNALAHQRMTQNGADAAAEAGAVIMAERFAGSTEPAAGWDATVQNAVGQSAAANGITVAAAYYTDICGIPLRSDGTAALNADNTYDFATAQRVGSGSLPTSLTSTPDCPSRTVGPAAGVLVKAHADVGTYLAQVIGISSLSVNTQATAAAGYLQESCAASEGAVCGLLPVAIPVDVISCDSHNSVVDTHIPWPVDGHTVSVIPLCTSGNGNVGWINWTGSGTKDLIAAVTNPDNPAIPLPSWQNVAQTGNVNAQDLETAIRAYDGQIVMVPQFDLVCNPGPNASPDSTKPGINTSPDYGCPPGDLGGNGTNGWYRMPSFAHLQLCVSTDPDCAAWGASRGLVASGIHGAYISGGNSAVCAAGGGTSCLVGKFESIISTGTIGAGFGGGQGYAKAVGVQLIK